jgi:hypothetical protein
VWIVDARGCFAGATACAAVGVGVAGAQQIHGRFCRLPAVGSLRAAICYAYSYRLFHLLFVFCFLPGPPSIVDSRYIVGADVCVCASPAPPPKPKAPRVSGGGRGTAVVAVPSQRDPRRGHDTRSPLQENVGTTSTTIPMLFLIGVSPAYAYLR